jgi:3-deoxy-manno-octulosonate cytidylyltransferase (CMP-KDO synthetase)
MKFIGIIPTRYGSTRFPGKPLADLCGKSVIERVYTRASEAMDNLVVATDDHRIADVVHGFGGNVVMTSPLHTCGTERCAEVVELLGTDADAIINIQGDEPFIEPDLIRELMQCMATDADIEIATLANRVGAQNSLHDMNQPKVIVDCNMNALAFKRDIDHVAAPGQLIYLHIGIYGYRVDVLRHIARLPISANERAESLEQYRWLDNGYRIKVGVSLTPRTVSIDTPEDLAAAKRYYMDHFTNAHHGE